MRYRQQLKEQKKLVKTKIIQQRYLQVVHLEEVV